MPETSKVELQISSKSNQLQSVVTMDNHQITIDEPAKMGGQDTGPSPMQLVLAALAGCENVMAHLIAKEMNFDLQDLSFEVKGTLDMRGLAGTVGVKPYFQNVSVQASVKTSEPNERLQELVTTLENRCPAFTLLRDAGVAMEEKWIIV